MTELPGLFITGTDTGVGKTVVAAAIARILVASGIRAGVLKPVATGAERRGEGWHCPDANALSEAIGGAPLERVAPILFEEPLAPTVAARRLGADLTRERVFGEVRRALDWWSGRADLIVVEGIGGWLCPLAEGTTVADLAVALDFPVVVVARRGLGTLNHTLLTVEAARRRGVRIAGVVLNGAEAAGDSLAEATNAGELARWLGALPILNEIAHGDDPEAALRDLDWPGRARPGRMGRAPDEGLDVEGVSGRSSPNGA